MRALVMLVALGTACGGSGIVLTSKDMSGSPTGGKGDAAMSGAALLNDACMHICSCFTHAAEVSSCLGVCSSSDGRYIRAQGSPSGSGAYSYRFNATSSGAPESLFYGGGSNGSGASGSGASGSNSTGSGPAAPPSACLSCLSTASCSDLKTGFVCQTSCPNYE